MTQKTAIVWFRQDLRLHDNPALHHALESGYNVLPVYILDDENAGKWKLGAARRWWVHHSLQDLNTSLDGHLVVRSGDAMDIIPQLIQESGANAIFWNRCYEPWRIARDTKIKDALAIENKSFNGSLLWEPWEVLKSDGTPYKVFTPFYRKGCLPYKEPDQPLPTPENIQYSDFDARGRVEDLNLLPDHPWHHKLESHWAVSEQGALDRLHDFLDSGLRGYKDDRNRPDRENVSRLSPYLANGNISPRTIWHTAQSRGAAEGWERDTDHFCSELGWREFSYSLLYHFPDLPEKPLQEKFAAFPWDRNDSALKAWRWGKTGLPLVDAGMRELYETGWMHNRVRMVVGSVLVKNLLLHWHHGEEWFWDCLVDADLANNAASWQWIAGCGADAAPYFRVFNPQTQFEKFDPDETYTRRFVKEYGSAAYPAPIIDLKASREKALEAFASTKTH